MLPSVQVDWCEVHDDLPGCLVSFDLIALPRTRVRNRFPIHAGRAVATVTPCVLRRRAKCLCLRLCRRTDSINNCLTLLIVAFAMGLPLSLDLTDGVVIQGIGFNLGWACDLGFVVRDFARKMWPRCGSGIVAKFARISVCLHGESESATRRKSGDFRYDAHR